MTQKIIQILLICLLISCGESTTKKQESKPSETPKEESNSSFLESADYSSLLVNYKCDMDSAEVAQAMGVSVSDLSIPDYASNPNFSKTGKCYFFLKGYGQTTLGDETQISWGTENDMSKADVKKEIDGYLERQKEMPEPMQKMTGMGIQLANTKDCYLVFQTNHGRILILNENYGAMVLSYGNVNPSFNRTTEQHEELKGKMEKLANYMLKKHRK